MSNCYAVFSAFDDKGETPTTTPKPVTLDALLLTQKTLRKELTQVNAELAEMKSETPQPDTTRKYIKVEANPNDLTPEEIFDILKNKNGWFGSDWGEPVVLKWDELEPDEKMQKRIAHETTMYNQGLVKYANLKSTHQELENHLIQIKAAISAEFAKLRS